MKRFVIILMSALCFFASFGTVAQAASDNLTPNNNESGDLGITIDGNFDDWADKTKQPMQHPWDNDNFKYASMLTDNNNIYLYILMQPVLSGGDTKLQPDGYTLNVGGKVFNIDLNHHSTVNLNVGEKKAIVLDIYDPSTGSYHVLNNCVYVANQYINQKMGDGRTVKGNGYVFEAKIPFKNLKGISNTSGQNISLENTNLWSGKLHVTGGSTGPVVLASTGFVIAIAAILKYSGFSFKKRRTV